MDIAKNKRYLNIPVYLLRDLYNDKQKFITDAFDVGVYIYSQTLVGDEEKQYRDALKFFKATKNSLLKRIPESIRNAKCILSNLPEIYPFFGIETNLLYKHYNFFNSDFEIICLGAFLGIKSIIGRKAYNKTNKSMIHARMFGYLTVKELPAQLTPLQKKYQIRWYIDKVLLELQLNWNLKVFCNHNRGFYVSFDLSFDDLAVIAHRAKRKYQIQQLKEVKKMALEKAKLTTS